MNNKKVCVSGYFIALHTGHIQYMREASKLGKLIVIINNNAQQILKYGNIIHDASSIADVIASLEFVDKVFISIDVDRTVKKSLKKIKPDYFCNGGDRNLTNIPEYDICRELGIELIFGVGGNEKLQSSSDILKRLRNDRNY